MSATQEQYGNQTAHPPFRLDVQIHELLTKSPAPRPVLLPDSERTTLPDPVFPQHPELLAQDDNYEENLERAPRDAAAGPRLWFCAL